MKTLTTILSFTLLLISFEIKAQDPASRKERMEKIESFKVGFLTSRMELTPDEAQKFWPVYNAYQEKLRETHRNLRNYGKAVNNKYSELSDKEIEKLVDDHILNRTAEADLLRDFHSQLKKILPIRKVGKYYQAEHEFKAELVRRLREQKGERGAVRPQSR